MLLIDSNIVVHMKIFSIDLPFKTIILKLTALQSINLNLQNNLKIFKSWNDLNLKDFEN